MRSNLMLSDVKFVWLPPLNLSDCVQWCDGPLADKVTSVAQTNLRCPLGTDIRITKKGQALLLTLLIL